VAAPAAKSKDGKSDGSSCAAAIVLATYATTSSATALSTGRRRRVGGFSARSPPTPSPRCSADAKSDSHDDDAPSSFAASAADTTAAVALPSMSREPRTEEWKPASSNAAARGSARARARARPLPLPRRRVAGGRDADRRWWCVRRGVVVVGHQGGAPELPDRALDRFRVQRAGAVLPAKHISSRVQVVLVELTKIGRTLDAVLVGTAGEPPVASRTVSNQQPH